MKIKLAVALGMSVLPSIAYADDAPTTPDQCRSYAAQKANEEYMSQRTTIRQTTPFPHSERGSRDPLHQSANQQADHDRTSREQHLYNDCVAKLPK